ncbi:MAG: RNA 2',3'-cyclic phosphodiesterase [Acidobacteria bacterium]|jgi:2'-5' RNA ligase|nr:RNA 2',3'-cyclic phosphodiesterase [Acidobacteriota bacterium]
MKRIFAAIDISEAARQAVSAYVEILHAEFQSVRVGWEKPEKLHLTLKFFGDVDERQLENLTEAIEQTARQNLNLNLQIAEAGVFPSPARARILWLGLQEETGNLQKLNENLETECARFGFAREERNFKAHLTIARLREPQKSKELIRKHLQNDFAPLEFQATEIVIYQSELLPKGSIYKSVSRHKLK